MLLVGRDHNSGQLDWRVFDSWGPFILPCEVRIRFNILPSVWNEEHRVGETFYSNCITRSIFALEGFTKSVQKGLNPKWNINLMILSPGGVKTSFADNTKYLKRHSAYASDPESPVTALVKWIKDPSLAATWADPDKCAAVLFDAVMGQKSRPLPMRLNIDAETLPMMRGEVDSYIKEMNDWEDETLEVNSSADGTFALMDKLIGKA